MSRPRIGGIAALVFMAALGAAPAVAQDIARGRDLFERNGCYQCHGYAGQGGAAPRIAPSAYPLEVFTVLVRRPANEMPAYARNVLSDDDLAEIYRYVRSIPEPPALADLPLLR